MSNRDVISFVLNGNLPFVRHPELSNPAEEHWFFESVSETYIPLLEVFDRLDREHLPFRMAVCLSPTLCQMLGDELLIQRYLAYTDRQIRFGEKELQRTSKDPPLNRLIRHFYDRLIEKREFFSDRLENNVIKGFDYYQKKGRLEILTTAVTHAFLPFYTACPEAVKAQLEVAITDYRQNFSRPPQGFWLPELGWNAELDSWLRAYNFNYTIVNSHALAFANPPAEKGTFYPARTPQGIVVFGRDFYAGQAVTEIAKDPVFRNNERDQGFELPSENLSLFLSSSGSRSATGYKYWTSDSLKPALYDPKKAQESAKNHAITFIKEALSRLKAAGDLIEGPAVSLCAFEADSFGRFWHEGPLFIEALFREAAKDDKVQFMTPTEYYCKQDSVSFQQVMPEFSSWGPNGYAEAWLDASNDWMYRHATRALDRMVEIVDRFPDSTGLKERALNQAAREMLLSLSSDWPKMLYKQENVDYAKSRVEGSLRNFTTIYEALGSNYISTDWLTQLERRNNIFPNINYRVFRRKG